jgi:hypothetical protein
VLSLDPPGGGFAHEAERLGYLIQLAARIPAARKLIQEILNPRAPAWKKGLALAVIAHAILQAIESRRDLVGHIETG